jgi:hypothetical protein
VAEALGSGAEFGDWSTAMIADAYGGDEAEEINARTGCVGCPLAQEDTALDTVLATRVVAYLEPLLGLACCGASCASRATASKPGIERLKDGSIAKNPQRMGPDHVRGTRRRARARAGHPSAVQCGAALGSGQASTSCNAEEEARIRELIAAETWPDGWEGDEPRADELIEKVYQNGARCSRCCSRRRRERATPARRLPLLPGGEGPLRRRLRLRLLADEVNPILKPHQRGCVVWAVQRGTAARGLRPAAWG